MLKIAFSTSLLPKFHSMRLSVLQVSMDRFPYDRDLRHERVNGFNSTGKFTKFHIYIKNVLI